MAVEGVAAMGSKLDLDEKVRSAGLLEGRRKLTQSC